MNGAQNFGWDRLRHSGLLLDTARLNAIANYIPAPLSYPIEQKLRRQVDTLFNGSTDVSTMVTFVLDQVCGFSPDTGKWQRGTQVGSEWTRHAVTGEAVKPRQLWHGTTGGILPVFFDTEKRVGMGRGRKTVSQVLQWLRAGTERLAIITNGRQWRLLFAGLDFEAWCEWDADLWFEEGALSGQVVALRTLLSPALWATPRPGEPPVLLQAIQDSRKGQAELSAVLGERVREAVEILVQAHGEVLKELCADVHPADIYRAAVRVVMRIVVALFAESRELLPRDNALYHGAYGITGLRESLEKQAARGGNRLARSWNAWPRVIGLFRLIYHGSHHQALLVPEYGGELFAAGDPDASGVIKALSVFEKACFDRELMSDKEVLLLLDHITRTRVKVRQGRGSIWMPAPVDFSDLSSEYIGILYEGLLDFELKTAPAGDPVVFLAIGNQPALPLSRLEAMDDKALTNLLEKLKDTNKSDDETGETEAEALADDTETDEKNAAEEDAEDADDDNLTEDLAEETDASADQRHATRTRAETWARRAVVTGKLVSAGKGKMTPEKKLAHEEKISRKAHQLVSRVVLPGEWYLVRWGGTRKGSGTFYTRPGLAVPTVQRTLQPLAYFPKKGETPNQGDQAQTSVWIPKKPEQILALKVCDPACGSGTFPVAALRYLTDALYAALHHHGRIREDGERSVVALIEGKNPSDEYLCQELLPCRPDDPKFEPRLKAVLRRHVVERCLYGVDLDALAVELCRLSLWIETMDRDLPFSFLDHKIKCGNSLVGAWFDQFQHYPVMAWKNREGGDKNHTNGVHFEKEIRTKTLKAFVKDVLSPDLLDLFDNKILFNAEALSKAQKAHSEALKIFSKLHDFPVHESAKRARVYQEEIVGSESYSTLKAAMDLWCACWFWPADQLEHAPLPTTFIDAEKETLEVAKRIALDKKFFHWELEFPDVFSLSGAGFDAILGNPPWDIAKPNSKEFFSNMDPLYRAYGKQEAVQFQKSYFADATIENEWIDYNADFRAQSNYMSHVASPYGDPEEGDKNQNRFSIKRGKANIALHTRWRTARAKNVGFSDPMHPFRHQGSADINLYKLFLELAHALLRRGGRLGFIVPSGLYSDHGTGALRELFLDKCSWEWIFGFENREGIFEIHRSFKFNPVIIEKGSRTESIKTAFMRRKLEDWEQGEAFYTSYWRDQVIRLSPKSKAVLEIQSDRDLEILEKIYFNSVLLGDDGPDGWGIRYNREFDMTNDSKLFPPRPKWEANGYRPDEYSRWIKGNWRPIGELWSELGVEPLKDGETRCAQPPYDSLPIPRAGIPINIILSRKADEYIREDDIEDIALPLYEGRMIGQFDFSQKGWVSGKGRTAVWYDIPWEKKQLDPQYLMGIHAFESSGKMSNRAKIAYMRISSSTNSRTTIATYLGANPAGDSVFFFLPKDHSTTTAILLSGIFSSIVFDVVIRQRLGGLNMSEFVMIEAPLPKQFSAIAKATLSLITKLSIGTYLFSREWIISNQPNAKVSLRKLWAVSPTRRIEQLVSFEALSAYWYGISYQDLRQILTNCDFPTGTDYSDCNPKGFWRVNKDKDPELRHTVLSLVAFHDLEEKIRECGGNCDKGVEAFLNQNDGEGWMLPETLRLADYGLGHDERAKQHQPVASRLGPRFYDWQLAQSPEESWRECHLHARNLLGQNGYFTLLGEVLSETLPADWEKPLSFACDLDQKQSLVSVFSSALRHLIPEVWKDRFEKAQSIASRRSFAFDSPDRIQTILGALKRIPDERRSQGISAAKQILGEHDFLTTLEHLLASVPRRSDHPWHIIIRQQVDAAVYQKITASLEMEKQNQVKEAPVDYSIENKKPTQIGLFD